MIKSQCRLADNDASKILVTDPPSSGYASDSWLAIGYSSESYMPVLHGGQGHVKFLQANAAYCSSMWNIDKTSPAVGAATGCGTLKP